MKSGERQLHLRLHARDSYQPQVRGRPGYVVQQHGLADPGLAPDHHDTAAPSADTVEQPVE